MIIPQLCGWTEDMWSAIIGLFSFIPNWGWMIIVFTVCLKIVLSPLDFWQRKIARTNAQKQAILQPELQKLQKKYGNNKQLLNQKTMELYKRENFSLAGSCFGMLINMALTLFIFFTLFTALTGMSNTQVVKQYNAIEDEYNNKFQEVFETTDVEGTQKTILDKAILLAQEELHTEEINDQVYSKALEIMYRDDATDQDFINLKTVQTDVLNKYNNEIKQGFLWVKNLWRPDTASSVFADFSTYNSIAKIYDSEDFKNKLNEKLDGITDEDERNRITNEFKKSYEINYNIETYGIQQNYKNVWNGYFILVVLAGVITYFSVMFSQMQSSKSRKKQQAEAGNLQQQQGGNAMKVMKFLLPVLMVIFTIGYSTAFALYIVTNSIMSTLISYILLKIFEHNEKNKKITISPKKNRPEYSREGM